MFAALFILDNLFESAFELTDPCCYGRNNCLHNLLHPTKAESVASFQPPSALWTGQVRDLTSLSPFHSWGHKAEGLWMLRGHTEAWIRAPVPQPSALPTPFSLCAPAHVIRLLVLPAPGGLTTITWNWALEFRSPLPGPAQSPHALLLYQTGGHIQAAQQGLGVPKLKEPVGPPWKPGRQYIPLYPFPLILQDTCTTRPLVPSRLQPALHIHPQSFESNTLNPAPQLTAGSTTQTSQLDQGTLSSDWVLICYSFLPRNLTPHRKCLHSWCISFLP